MRRSIFRQCLHSIMAALVLGWSTCVPLKTATAAPGNWTLYAHARQNSWLAAYNIGTTNFNLILVTSSYTPSVNNDATYADVSANEVAAGGGYSTGGQTATVTQSLSSGTLTVSMSAVTWSSATITAKYAVLLSRAGGSLASTDKLVVYLDLNSGGGSVSSTSGNFTVSAPSGLFTSP